MKKFKYEKVTRYKFIPPDIVKIITYYRKKGIPTLKQYAIRKNFGKFAKQTKGLKGTIQVEDHPIPKSAYEMKKVTGIKAEDLITPELIKEYEKKFGVKVKKF